MEHEAEKTPQKTPVPSRNIRLAWWWGFYFGGCLGGSILFNIYTRAPLELLGIAIVRALFIVVLLPFGLASVFGCLIAACIHGEWHPTYNEEETWMLLTIPLSYGIFALHRHLTYNTTSRRAFLLLMLSLILLICGSLIGCVQEANQPLGLQ